MPQAPWTSRIGVFDFETTGVNPDTERVVTAFIGILNAAGEVTDRWSWLVNPGVPIPEAATRVHGVTSERAQREGQPAAAAVAEITRVLQQMFAEGVPVVAYNAAYDFTVLDRECARYGVQPPAARPVIDPLILDKQFDRYRKGKRTLSEVAPHYGVSLDGAHEAEVDAVAAGRVAQAMARKFAEARVDALTLHDQQVVWAKEQAESFAAWRQSKGQPLPKLETGWPVRD